MNDALSILSQPVILPNGTRLPTRIFQGPMEGVTEGTYMALMEKRHWVKCWWTPFLRISNSVPRNSKIRHWLEPYLAGGLPVIAQIMGCDIQNLAGAATRLAAAGASVIDLNCACPSRNVISSQAGGFRLKFPEWIRATLLAIRQAIPSSVAVSVKVRSGYASPEEMETLLPAIAEAAPDMVAMHFRTVTEQYRPVEHGLERLARARELLPGTFFIGCGNLFTIDDARQMIEETGIDAIAPARGLMANPALLAQLEQACRKQQILPFNEPERLAFLQDMLEFHPNAKTRGYVMQSAVRLLAPDHPWIAQLRTPTKKSSRLSNEI